MTTSTTKRTTADGLELATRHWSAADAAATIVIVHGLAEHIGRYDHVARQFNERGYHARGTDLRGFGASGGARAYVADFGVYLDDLAGDVEEAQQTGRPIVLLGHSMGGLIATLYAESGRPQPDLLVLSAPSIDADIPTAKRVMAKALVRLVPRLRVANGLDGAQLSHDPAVGERYFSDPLVFPRSTLRLGVELMGAMERAREHLGALAIPMLVIHGAEDTIVSPRFSEVFETIPGATRLLLGGFRHESFNEDGGTRAVNTIADWIEGQL